MNQYNAAQTILIMCGVHGIIFDAGINKHALSLSWTKKGPGRKHNNKTKKQMQKRIQQNWKHDS